MAPLGVARIRTHEKVMSHRVLCFLRAQLVGYLASHYGLSSKAGPYVTVYARSL